MGRREVRGELQFWNGSPAWGGIRGRPQSGRRGSHFAADFRGDCELRFVSAGNACLRGRVRGYVEPGSGATGVQDL